jgi:hypothetical protein
VRASSEASLGDGDHSRGDLQTRESRLGALGLDLGRGMFVNVEFEVVMAPANDPLALLPGGEAGLGWVKPTSPAPFCAAAAPKTVTWLSVNVAFPLALVFAPFHEWVGSSPRGPVPQVQSLRREEVSLGPPGNRPLLSK